MKYEYEFIIRTYNIEIDKFDLVSLWHCAASVWRQLFL